MGLASICYLLIIVGFSAGGIVQNVGLLLSGKKAGYHLNPLFLSGTLMLFDRGFFFESRQVQLFRKDGQVETLEFDVPDTAFNSYVQRRLFRMISNELKCGMNTEEAIQDLYCRPREGKPATLRADSIEILFSGHLPPFKKTKFKYLCEAGNSQ